MKKTTQSPLSKKEFCVKNKYIIEFDFNEFKMLQESIEKMHHDEFYAHWLSEFLKSKLQMTEELENEALDLAGEAWEMVKRGYGKNLPKTFDEMVESMREYVKNKRDNMAKNYVADKDVLLELAGGALALTQGLTGEEVKADRRAMALLKNEILDTKDTEIDYDTMLTKIKVLRAKYE